MSSKRTVVLTVALAGLTWSACAHAPKPEVAVEAGEATRPAAAPEQRVQLTGEGTGASEASRELDLAIASAQVLFEFNSDNLQPRGTAALQQVGQVLKRDANLRVRIEGNCDERGTAEYNVVLGQRRAEVARHYLEALGVKSSQVETVSYGAERPANADHTEAAWSQNRRDDLKRAAD